MAQMRAARNASKNLIGLTDCAEIACNEKGLLSSVSEGTSVTLQQGAWSKPHIVKSLQVSGRTRLRSLSGKFLRVFAPSLRRGWCAVACRW